MTSTSCGLEGSMRTAAEPLGVVKFASDEIRVKLFLSGATHNCSRAVALSTKSKRIITVGGNNKKTALSPWPSILFPYCSDTCLPVALRDGLNLVFKMSGNAETIFWCLSLCTKLLKTKSGTNIDMNVRIYREIKRSFKMQSNLMRDHRNSCKK